MDFGSVGQNFVCHDILERVGVGWMVEVWTPQTTGVLESCFFQSVLWHTSSGNQQLYCLFFSDDETRVVLSEVVKAPGADYINANYIAVSISIIYYNFLPLAALACTIMSNFMHYTWPIKEQTYVDHDQILSFECISIQCNVKIQSSVS